ncbi:sensor domain-containing protein [Halospina denitrificans]|nr:bifunctional diguanylate cyclase/phosphodiesterase [Halospina denitrificans]
MHDVQVYQVELEVQNQDLIEAQQELEEARDRYASLYDFAPNGYLTTNERGVITRINLTGAHILGYERDALVGIPLNALMENGQTRKYLLHINQLAATDEPLELDLKIRCRDKSTKVLRLHSYCSHEHGEQVFHTAFQDVTEEQETEEQLRQAARVFESTLEAIVITDEAFRITKTNHAFTRITGYPEEQILGKDLSLVVGKERQSGRLNRLQQDMRQGGDWQGEFEVARSDGSTLSAWGTLSTAQNPSEQPSHHVLVFSDISSLKEAYSKLDHLAHHDALTGLPNRLFLSASLDQALKRARRHQSKLALFFIDLDHFKTINDTLGHSSGDHLLSVVADRLKGFVREEDLVARLGGDEFVVLLNDIDSPESAGIVAEKILGLINQPVQFNDETLVTGASIGISLYPGDAENGEDLTKAADAALYRAKQEGRNHHSFYTPELTQQAQQRLGLEQGLRRALSRDQLQLFYQPQQSLIGNGMSGVEGLLRWQNDEHRLVAAKEFIPTAEKSYLVNDLDDYALRTACAQAATWKALYSQPIRISVNLSPRSLFKPGLAETMKQLFDEFDIGPEWIELEVTESALQGGEAFMTELTELKALGVTLAIDDFGTGHSCLASLKTLPVDRLKIDQTFITNAPFNRQDAAIVRAIIALGHSLGLTVIAEGVETQSQRDFLLREHCDEIQGYFYHRPLSAAQMLALVS